MTDGMPDTRLCKMKGNSKKTTFKVLHFYFMFFGKTNVRDYVILSLLGVLARFHNYVHW